MSLRQGTFPLKPSVKAVESHTLVTHLGRMTAELIKQARRKISIYGWDLEREL
jgi:hypothetical protein